MKKPNRIFLISLSFILILLTGGCKSQQEQLAGFWENEYKIMEFTEDTFVIYNKNAAEVIAFSGSYTFAFEPSYAVKMKYENFMDSSGQWKSLKGSDLENYTDILLFKITDNFLETKVLGNDQKYSYQRIKNPMKN